MSKKNGHSNGEPFLRRVAIRNYKSIAACDVRLGKFTVLVGRNGAGKSNFLDALQFVKDALQFSIDEAFRLRNGAAQVLHEGPAALTLCVRLEMCLETGLAHYGFKLFPGQASHFVEWEEFRSAEGAFLVEKGELRGEERHLPPVSENRLYLASVGGIRPFREAFEKLMRLGIYSFGTDAMRVPQPTDLGQQLKRDGSNLASVMSHLQETRRDVVSRIHEYVRELSPDITRIIAASFEGGTKAILFNRRSGPLTLSARNMSDGTLRFLAILIALSQLNRHDASPPLIGIEEPEAALHPAAIPLLLAAFREATTHSQVLVTTQSSDLCDHLDFDTDDVLVVQLVDGKTQVGPMDRASHDSIVKHLYTAGELIRMDQLDPDLGSGKEANGSDDFWVELT